MKLFELTKADPTNQAVKVFESYFGKAVDFTTLTHGQAQTLLDRVCNLISEHRRTPNFHSSEQNPAYLKLIVLEKILKSKLVEETVAPATGATTPADAQKQKAMQTVQIQQRKRQLQDAIRSKQEEIRDLQKQMNNPTLVAMAENRLSLRQRLKEASEIQQAQVVLASQDMVDQVQKMSEQISAMQFKDLPALVDQIKNEVGTDQAMQFNTDATAALAGLLQNLQGAKTQLEAALGVVTGQAPVVPGQDMTADQDLAVDIPASVDDETVTDIEVDDDELDEPVVANLGRTRR